MTKQKLTPKQISEIAGEGITEDENALLQSELAKLLGEHPEHIQHSTGMGAALGGIGEGLDRATNNIYAGILRGKVGSNFDRQRGTMATVAGQLQPQTGTAAPGSPAAATSLPTGVPDPVQPTPFGAMDPRRRSLLVPPASPFSF